MAIKDPSISTGRDMVRGLTYQDGMVEHIPTREFFTPEEFRKMELSRFNYFNFEWWPRTQYEEFIKQRNENIKWHNKLFNNQIPITSEED